MRKATLQRGQAADSEFFRGCGSKLIFIISGMLENTKDITCGTAERWKKLYTML